MPSSIHVAAIIAAGGRGHRLGGAVPKQLLPVGGRPILERSLAAFLSHPLVAEIVVALPPDLAADPPAYLRAAGARLQVVSGGERRQDSVRNAFLAVSERAEIVVVHDAARPFVTRPLIDRTIDAAVESGAALAALRSRDTVKLAVAGDPGAPFRLVARTLPRDGIFLAQTPQAFRRSVLRDALELAAGEGDATDEATLVERTGHSLRLVEGDERNIKVTTAPDLAIAEMFAGEEARADAGQRRADEQEGAADWGRVRLPGAVRVGTGYDLHRLVEGRPLVLGGVTIPFERGLLGHSDADAICHAVTDAVLGACGAGDIGRHFPDTDAAWRGASSIDLLRRASTFVRSLGFVVSNVDVVVIAERPRIGPFIAAMQDNLARALDIPPGVVSVKGKTNEGVGAIGRGEAIAVQATALVVKLDRS